MLIIVLLVIIAVGIMNTMWIAIRERTREIGTLRAIGMQRARVLRYVPDRGASCSGSPGDAAPGPLLGAAVGAGAQRRRPSSVPEAVQIFLMQRERCTSRSHPGRWLGCVAFITALHHRRRHLSPPSSPRG